MAQNYGFTLPFLRASGSLGWLETTREKIEAAKTNLISLLLTNWGDRVMHYRMGCNLIEFLFENKRDIELKNKIADRIFEQVGTWIGYLSIDELNVLFYNDDPTIPEQNIRVKMKFTLKGDPDIENIGSLDLLI